MRIFLILKAVIWHCLIFVMILISNNPYTVFDLLQSSIEYNASITNLSLRDPPTLTCYIIR